MFCKKKYQHLCFTILLYFLTLDSLFMWFLADMAYSEDISQTIFGIMTANIEEYYSLLRCKRYLVEAEIIKGKLNTSFQLPVFA